MSPLEDFVANVLAASTPDRHWASGTVTSVQPGAAKDGNALVFVDWNGTEVACAYLNSYTPAVGHRVLMIRAGSQLAILGRLVGTPPTATPWT